MLDIELLKKLGADTDEGLAYCADDPEFYEEMICEYINEYESRLADMQTSFEKKDFKQYGICAHSLKNTSRMIGLGGLAAKAAQLETASKASDENSIASGHAGFLDEYGKSVDGLKKAAGIA